MTREFEVGGYPGYAEPVGSEISALGKTLNSQPSKECRCQDSNLDLEFRKLLFYPLNYSGIGCGQTSENSLIGSNYPLILLQRLFTFFCSPFNASFMQTPGQSKGFDFFSAILVPERRVGFQFVAGLLILGLMGCQTPTSQEENLLPRLLQGRSPAVDRVLSDPEGYELQILYTQVERDSSGAPQFTRHAYRLDSSRYFYPASTVKFPTALMALEKMKALGLPATTPMLTDSLRPAQTAVRSDSSAAHGLPSVAHYVRKIFLVSDNDAYNRLYEFVGQGPLNRGLRAKGYDDLRLTHRLSIFLPLDENRHTNPVRFLLPDGSERPLPAQYNADSIPLPAPILKGRGELVGDSVVMEPKDFASKNFFPLHEQQAMLQALIFPESVPDSQRWDLRPEDRQLVLTAMSQLPRESDYPAYDPAEYYDSYVKYVMFGDSQAAMPDHIRVYNKVGQAYGYLTDNAYVVDEKNGVEFFLSATLLVNRNGIFNDGVYEYEELGFPFLAELGRALYEHASGR